MAGQGPRLVCSYARLCRPRGSIVCSLLFPSALPAYPLPNFSLVQTASNCVVHCASCICEASSFRCRGSGSKNFIREGGTRQDFIIVAFVRRKETQSSSARLSSSKRTNNNESRKISRLFHSFDSRSRPGRSSLTTWLLPRRADELPGDARPTQAT